ncbi:peptidase associated/transthyretin-like domain-containing protein [Pseudarthrobacter chlorophenolicus]|uniref:hypothetical protein n=1 Tax=Pseudarthrobacter chlorophenolicus TaxID=85085 RepID=UPI00030E91CB|nr:hypothetical protein [Pseudarthrobacter chlorophenolicus]
MKKTVLAVVLTAAALLSAGCASEPIPGAIVQQEAQGKAGQAAGPVDAMASAKARIEAKAYASPVVAEHESMMAGQDWTVTGGGWTPGAAVTVTLTSADGTAVGTGAKAVADAEGHIDSVITIPEGTATGTYTLAAATPTDTKGAHTAKVNIFSS